jgi:hypothetical protein
MGSGGHEAGPQLQISVRPLPGVFDPSLNLLSEYHA